jgi:predicted ArsR family transcriptional regulator
MRLTAKDVADRLSVSYVIASGLLAYLEDVGKAKVVEKRFHSSGRGKPTRVYEVDQHTTIDFGDVVVEEKVEVTAVEAVVDEIAVVPDVAARTAVVEVLASEPAVEEPVEKIETLDHVAAALARLRAAQSDAA